jgi:hypothetical protein
MYYMLTCLHPLTDFIFEKELLGSFAMRKVLVVMESLEVLTGLIMEESTYLELNNCKR